MKRKIQRSMMTVLVLTLAVSYLLLTLFVYRQTLDIMEDGLAEEARYISRAVKISGESYLADMDAVERETRVTLIDENGAVLYDSFGEEDSLENHATREEVQEALESGVGRDIRLSDTVGLEMFYYALRMDDGNVLRVARDMDTVWRTALNVLPFMAVTGVIMTVFAWGISRYLVGKLIHPINNLDLEEPLENDVYEEMAPLLERIDRQNKEKEQIEQMRKEFSANVSHELKTPLTSISGYAEIMMNGLVKPEDVQGFAERIYKEASRMITLVGDIIKLSKLDEGSVEVEKENVDLYLLAREICSRLAPQAEKKKVHLEVSGEHTEYFGIRQIIDEMIFNITENAVKYNKEGGKVSIWVGNTLQGRRVIVQDTGIGIPKEHQERIFERFYRVDKSHSRESGGTGLGLSIVKHGALLHHADISVESEPGKGTRMEINFH